MTKAEAIQSMDEGKRVKHKYFSSKEWMEITSDNNIVFEDGCRCSFKEFFSIRTGTEWDSGWSIVE